MNTDKDTKNVLAGLSRPFPPEAIKTREGGGRKRLSYVEGHSVIHRLNDVCGEWSFSIIREWQEGDLLKAQVSLTIPGLGSREHIGVQRVSPNGGEDLHKGHVTDGLKKAATLFGVGLELYGPDYEAGGGGKAVYNDQPAPPTRSGDRFSQPPVNRPQNGDDSELPEREYTAVRRGSSSGDNDAWKAAKEDFRNEYHAARGQWLNGKEPQAAAVADIIADYVPGWPTTDQYRQAIENLRVETETSGPDAGFDTELGDPFAE